MSLCWLGLLLYLESWTSVERVGRWRGRVQYNVYVRHYEHNTTLHMEKSICMDEVTCHL